jgi:hypothetical protein
LIVAKKAIPANDLRGFIDWLKNNPDTASEGNAGSAARHRSLASILESDRH